jgi:putative PIN family toxin of toxin-antitoxin system
MSAPPAEPVRVVVDTNVVLPALTGNMPERNWLRELWMTGRIVTLVNEETLTELREKVLERSPSPKEYQADLFLRKTMRPYQQRWESIPVRDVESPVCRDRKDQKFIDLAFAGNADCLVTRDRDLTDMDEELPFQVVNDAEFRQIMEG